MVEANEAARRVRVLPGMRYATALSLCPGLHATAAPPEEVVAGIDEVVRLLQRFTPFVEPVGDPRNARGQKSGNKTKGARGNKRSGARRGRAGGRRDGRHRHGGHRRGGRASSSPSSSSVPALLGEPGLFRLDASGLERLHPTLTDWAGRLERTLSTAGFAAAVVVGRTSFATAATAHATAAYVTPERARSGHGHRAEPGQDHRAGHVHVFPDLASERETLRRVPLSRLPLSPRLRDALDRLGIRRVGAFLDLPRNGLARRFGQEADDLHRLASGEWERPLVPREALDPPSCSVSFERPESRLDRLMAVVRRELPALLALTAERRQALAALEVRLRVETHGEPATGTSARADAANDAVSPSAFAAAPHPIDVHPIDVQPARPTLEAARVEELLSLRLAAFLRGLAAENRRRLRAASSRARGRGRNQRRGDPTRAHPDEGLFAAAAAARESGVTQITLTVRPVTARTEQLRLFRENPRRELAAAARALARVRAEHGPRAVVHARLTGGHLPEARFAWQPLEQTRFPRPRRTAPHVHVVRRLLARPLPLAPRPRHEPDGWMLGGLRAGSVRRHVGPHVVSGGWWSAQGREVHRVYHSVETARGDLLWVFHDRARRRWFLHGAVE